MTKEKALTIMLILSILTFTVISTNAFAIDAPILSVTTANSDLSLSWSNVPGATGYKLYFAPNPYLGPNTISSVDIGTNTSFSVTLWDGASFFIAVTALDGSASGESNYSNIELFTIQNLAACSNFAGSWLLVFSVSCANNIIYTAHDTVQISQNGCDITSTGSVGDIITGSASGNKLDFNGTYTVEGMSVQINGTLSLENDGEMTGSANTNFSLFGCGSDATIQGFPK